MGRPRRERAEVGGGEAGERDNQEKKEKRSAKIFLESLYRLVRIVDGSMQPSKHFAADHEGGGHRSDCQVVAEEQHGGNDKQEMSQANQRHERGAKRFSEFPGR